MAAKRKAGRTWHEVPVHLPPHVKGLLGDEAEVLLEALRQPPPVSIRLNPDKPVDIRGEQVPWCQWGRYLPERPLFTLDPRLHAGAYYVQEAGSMLLEQAVAACGPLPERAVVLDLCAAPGGKSTHLASLLGRDALLIANEMVASRQAILAENLWKWGRPDTILTRAAPGELAAMGAFCDLVVVDAPCSGEGMFRKDPHARAQWGTNLVETCALRQRDILGHAWALIKPGGCLIYSTCTWETSENEDQVEWLLQQGASRLPMPLEEAWGVVPTDGGWRCYPHRMKGEGFFISVVRKPMEGREVARAFGKGVHEPWPEALRGWINDPGAKAVIRAGDALYALDASWAGLVAALMSTVQVTAPGTPVAIPKGGEWMPHPALALSALLDREAFPAIGLDRAQALAYLRGEAIPAREASGVALVRHQGLGLGWVQGAGNRWNNRWPAAWRIRMR